jgi:hypothetical protein
LVACRTRLRICFDIARVVRLTLVPKVERRTAPSPAPDRRLGPRRFDVATWSPTNCWRAGARASSMGAAVDGATGVKNNRVAATHAQAMAPNHA